MADDDRQALIASAGRLGISPLDLATVISYETRGTFSPSIRGGAGNRHIGMIQFGPAEQRQYGASQDQSFSEQLPAVERYLTDRGLKPGMGRLDLYSTINAGRPGLYGASDAGNGGAPGTVADKVRDQMGGHEAKARAFLGGDFKASMPAQPDQPAQPVATGRFGFSGIEASPATAAAPQPALAKDDGPDLGAILKTLMSNSSALPGTGAAAAPAAAPPAPRLEPPRRLPFDAAGFFAQLGGRPGA